MTTNLLPDLLDRPLRQFPTLLPNLLSSPWANFFDTDLFPQDISNRGIQIYEKDNQLHVEMPLPGLNLKDIEVTLNQGVLLVKGELKQEEEDKKKKFYRSSRRSYSYSLALPTQIDEKQEPQAVYTDGILNISLQLAHQGDTKKITVKSGNGKK